MARDERYDRATEFATVVRGLWDSWAEDAFPEDKAAGSSSGPIGSTCSTTRGSTSRSAGRSTSRALRKAIL